MLYLPETNLLFVRMGTVKPSLWLIKLYLCGANAAKLLAELRQFDRRLMLKGRTREKVTVFG